MGKLIVLPGKEIRMRAEPLGGRLLPREAWDPSARARPGPTFGIELFQYDTAANVLADALLCERLGYDSVWLGDSQLLWREAWTMLGAIAARTERILLGNGVTNPITRHLTVTASAATTLQELSEGRALVGIGAGFTAVRMLDQEPASLATIRQYVRDVRALAEGQPITRDGAELRLAFGGPGCCPPLLLAAGGPRMLQLAGEEFDGVILQQRARADDSLRGMLDALRAGRATSTRRDRPFLVCLGAAAAVDADRAKALAAVKGHVAVSILKPRWPVSDAARAAQPAVQAAYSHGDHMSPESSLRLAAAIPDEAVSEFALAGTPAECVAQARALFEAGVDEITFRPYALPGQSRAAMIEVLTREVVVPLRGR